jgi:hypothetical protein
MDVKINIESKTKISKLLMGSYCFISYLTKAITKSCFIKDMPTRNANTGVLHIWV